MEIDEIVRTWRTLGFVVLPGYLPAADVERAAAELPELFPTAAGFHDRTDPRRDRFVGDEFAGIDTFPLDGVALNLLAVHPRVVGLAEALLGERDIRLSSTEAWAKYTGAADYDQDLHRDYLNHTVLVPARDLQLEMFVYLVDVADDLGAPRLVPRRVTADLPAKPNWYPRHGGDADESGWQHTADCSALYAAEQSAAGPAGTVVVFGLDTFHRGTALTRPRGARYTMHLAYRTASAEWGQRQAWAARSHDPAWYRFVARATPRQLELIGFPPPGDPHWTTDTLAATGQRYPGLDLAPWTVSGGR